MLLLLDLAQHAPRWTAHHFVNPYTALASLVLTAIAAALSFVRLSTASKNDKARGQASAPPHPHHPPSPPPTSRLLGHRGFPVYDAAFNLRLSYLYGPIILLQHGPAHPLHLVASLLPSFLRPLLPAVAPTWRPHDTTILVNSEQHARHILDRLGAHYSSRAPSIAAGKYLSHGRRLVLQPYGPVWRTHHRALMSVLSRDKLRGQWDPVMRYEAAEMVLRIADGIEAFRASATHPPSIFQETSRFTASSVLQIAYARRAATPQDPVLVDLDRVSQGIARAFEPGRFLVERLPILDLVPSWLAPWKQRLQAWHRAEHDVYSGLVQDVQDRLPSEPGPGHKGKRQQTDLAGGSILSPSSCATATLLSMRQKLHLDVDDISYISATIFEAGTETTATTIDTFLVAMACYPEVARRLRAELDRLFVPASSLGGAGGEGDDDDDEERWVPDFDTLRRAPYLAAVLKEVLRFTPTGSSGVAHTSSHTGPDDLDGGGLEGVRIWGGVSILPNIYGIHRHHSTTSSSSSSTSLWTFDPSRHLTSTSSSSSMEEEEEGEEATGTTSLDLTSSTHAFGFGRRKCPGSVLASHSLWIATSLVVLHLDLSLDDVPTANLVEGLRGKEERSASKFRRAFPDVVETQAWKDERRFRATAGEGDVLLDAFIRGDVSRDQLRRVLVCAMRESRPLDRLRAWVRRARSAARDVDVDV